MRSQTARAKLVLCSGSNRVNKAWDRISDMLLLPSICSSRRASDLDIGVMIVPLRRSAGQDRRVGLTGEFDARSDVRDIRQIILCIEASKEARVLGLPDEKIVPVVQHGKIIDDGPLLRGRERQNPFQHLPA